MFIVLVILLAAAGVLFVLAFIGRLLWRVGARFITNLGADISAAVHDTNTLVQRMVFGLVRTFAQLHSLVHPHTDTYQVELIPVSVETIGVVSTIHQDAFVSSEHIANWNEIPKNAHEHEHEGRHDESGRTSEYLESEPFIVVNFQVEEGKPNGKPLPTSYIIQTQTQIQYHPVPSYVYILITLLTSLLTSPLLLLYLIYRALYHIGSRIVFGLRHDWLISFNEIVQVARWIGSGIQSGLSKVGRWFKKWWNKLIRKREG